MRSLTGGHVVLCISPTSPPSLKVLLPVCACACVHALGACACVHVLGGGVL